MPWPQTRRNRAFLSAASSSLSAATDEDGRGKRPSATTASAPWLEKVSKSAIFPRSSPSCAFARRRVRDDGEDRVRARPVSQVEAAGPKRLTPTASADPSHLRDTSLAVARRRAGNGGCGADVGGGRTVRKSTSSIQGRVPIQGVSVACNTKRHPRFLIRPKLSYWCPPRAARSRHSPLAGRRGWQSS